MLFVKKIQHKLLIAIQALTLIFIGHAAQTKPQLTILFILPD